MKRDLAESTYHNHDLPIMAPC